MKKLLIATMLVSLGSFSFTTVETKKDTIESVQSSSFSILNDTKDAVSIYTGAGFVTLQKGSKTSVTCNVGKEVRFGDSGKKGDLIFKIEDSHCGTTVKLSAYI